MKYVSIILILGCLCVLFFSSSAYAAVEVEERRDFEVADPDGVFKQALKEIEKNMPSGFNAEKLSRNKYYIQTIYDDEPGDLGDEFMLVMVDDGTSSDTYYTVLYGMPEMWPIHFVIGTYRPPFGDTIEFDEYFDWVMYRYDVDFAESREEFYAEDDEDDTPDSANATESGGAASPNRHPILDTVNTK